MDATRETVGILVVGAGFLGTQRASAARAATGTSLVGVVDVDLSRARALASRLGGFATGSLEEGLEFEGVDAVVVATPHADHVESVEHALSRGKHVLCEKPLAIDADAAWRLAHMADDARLRLTTGFNHRFYPPVRDALALVSDRGVGRVEGVRARIGHLASAEFLAGWHGDFEQSGGGTLLDNGPHACDLIRRFLGEVEVAIGTIRHDPDGPPGCEREAFGLFRNCDRAIGELHSSWSLRTGYLTIEVRGSTGWLELETAPWRLRGRLADGRRLDRRYLGERVAERLFRLRHGCERSLAQELESFAHAIAGLPTPAANGWDGCRAVEMAQAIYESDRRGAEVSLARPRNVPGAEAPPSLRPATPTSGGRP
jgi:UDP-N-acetyl-2-amino-2-deoxyglucuronate dehydrogenase